MRIIKFRAWDSDVKKMFLVDKLTTMEWITWIQHAGGKGNYELMQFTGLLDKNGVEIYEGDIVKCPNPDFIMTVKFGRYAISGDWETGFCDSHYYGFYLENADEIDHFGTFDGTKEGFEVIGNVFDNPELIKS